MTNFFGTKNKQPYTKQMYFALGIVFLIALWIILSLIINNELMLPSITKTMNSLFEIIKSRQSYVVLFSTFLRLVIGVSISVVLAFLLFVLIIWNNNVLFFFRPLLALAKTTPVAALIIILLIWFGSTYSPIIICVFVLFPLIVETLLLGLERIDVSYIEEMQLNGEHFLYSLVHIYIPFIKPYFYMSLLQCLGLGMKVMVTSELISQTPNSIGLQMYLNRIYLDMSGLFAWTIILVTLVIIFEICIKKWQRRIAI